MLKTGLLSLFVKCPKKCNTFQTIAVNYRLFSGLKVNKCILSLPTVDSNHSEVSCRYSHSDHKSSSNADEEETNEYERSDGWTKAEDHEDAVKGAFENFKLSPPTIQKLKGMGIEFLFPVQTNTYHSIFDGSDVIVQARTGSGKTMSYAIPLVEKLIESCNTNERSRSPKLLVLTPTRELANQVAQVLASLTNQITVVPVYGGASINNQENQLRRGADVVVATPGRLIDLISRRSLSLTQLNHVVLDEVDRMLDMGFADDVDKILKMRYNPEKRQANPQTLLFSATVPSWVQRTAQRYLSRSLQMLDLIGTGSNKTAVSVKHTAMLCHREQREVAIIDLMNRMSRGVEEEEDGGIHRTIVFCQTKREVDELGRRMGGRMVVLHGDVSQASRDVALRRFKAGEVSCMAATDVAARGLDIPDVDLVIQCSPPPDVEAYIHRSGRTGRAGKRGTSVVLYTPDEAHDVTRVEAVARFKFERCDYERSDQVVKDDVIRSLKRVTKRVRDKYDGLKNELVDELGGGDALMQAAVAILAGHSQKSLINQRLGLTTLHLHQEGTPIKLSHASKLIDLLKASLPDHLTSLVREVRLCADFKGAVFDIPAHKEDAFLQAWSEQPSPFKLSVPSSLPSIMQAAQCQDSRGHRAQDFKRYSPGGGDRRSSYAGGDRRRSYGGGGGDSNDRGDRRNSYDTFGRDVDRGGVRGTGRGRDSYRNFTHARSAYGSLQD